MHEVLEKEFSNLKKLAFKKETSLVLIRTQLDCVAFVSSGEKVVCLVIVEEKFHDVLSCFKVNLNKWTWAENEGFDLSGKNTPKDVVNEILIPFKTFGEYLKYLDLA